MKVLTWNILASEWIDNELTKKIGKEEICNSKKRLDRIMSYIDDTKPDIILLQEVMPMEYKKLHSKWSGLYNISKICRKTWYGINGKCGNVTMIHKTVITNNQISHKKCEHALYTIYKSKNKECLVLNIHLDDQDVKTRYAQKEDILLQIKDAKNVIIGGDFNHAYQKNSKLYDFPGYTIHNTECATYYMNRKMNIDNILTKGFKPIPYSVCPNYPTTEKSGIHIYGSDHLPILMEIGSLM